VSVPGLLVDVQRRLESLYALTPEAPVTDFLLSEKDATGFPGGGSRTLIAQDGDFVSLGVVLDPGVGALLAELDPRVHLDGRNLDSFCNAIEEVSHFVYLLFCARAERTVTQLELELQAEVDKYLCAVFLLSMQNDGAVSMRLLDLLFHHYRIADTVSDERAERYRAASHLAYRYCRHLEERFLKPKHLADLARESRRFYRLGQREKLEKISELQ
jgi:hypothetical protein